MLATKHVICNDSEIERKELVNNLLTPQKQVA